MTGTRVSQGSVTGNNFNPFSGLNIQVVVAVVAGSSMLNTRLLIEIVLDAIKLLNVPNCGWVATDRPTRALTPVSGPVIYS